MAMQVGNSIAPLSPQMIGSAFVQQYYNVLHGSPEQVHKFYHDSSTLSRPDSNGAMTTVTTIHDINEEILSTDFTSCLIKLENVDAQTSLNGGVLILVTGSFDQHDTVNRRFSQSFFLAPQESGGYFVLNDMLRYIPEMLSDDALVNTVDDNTQSGTLTAEPETTSVNVKETADLELPSAENVAVNDNVLPTNDNATVKDVVVVEACVEVTSESVEKIPEAAPAPSASAQKDVTKQSYASVVKVTKEGAQPTPVAKPKPKPKPKPAAKVVENAEKSVPLPVKPTQAVDSTSPNEKDVPVEHGYSVFVKNLPFNSTVEMVEEKFKKFGAIRPGCIQVRNRQPDRFCFGFVEFESRESMLAAIEASPISFGSKESYVEEKRTTTRVVNGVVHSENNGNARGGGRFQQDRGGYRGDNFRGREAGFMNNASYRDGDNMRNGFRNQSEYRGRGPQGNGFHQNGTGGYHQNGNGGYHQNGNRYSQNRNGYHQNGDDYYQNGNGHRQNGNGYYRNGNGYHQERPFHNGNGNGRSARFIGPRPTPVNA